MFVLDKVTDFLLLLGKLVVVGAVGVLSFYFFSGEWMGEIIKESSSHHFQLSWLYLTITFPHGNAREESLVTNTES